MSSVRRGVLRAIRLLPDTVKIGLEAETALPSVQEEEQISHEDSPRGPAPEKILLNLEKTQVQLPEWHEKKEKAPPADPSKDSKELKRQIESLQKSLSDAETGRTQLMEKITSAETELARVKEAAARREREMTADIEAAKEQARAEGSALGHAEGLDSGYKAGLEKARVEVAGQYREKFTGLAELLEGVSAKLEACFAELSALNEPRMLRLWQGMLEKMLQREMILEPKGVLDVLAGVLPRLSDRNRILIYVSPEDQSLLQESLQGEFEDILRGVKHLELKSDTNVDKGSCIVETNLGVYDARWRTQFEQIDAEIEKLLQKLGKPPKIKTETRRTRKGSGQESPAPPIEPAELEDRPAQLQPEQAQPAQAEFVQADGEPKPAAKKRAPSKKKALSSDG